MEVVLVNPSEYGIEEKKATELIGNLPQLKAERDVLAKQYDEIVLLDIEEPTTAFKAKELRLRIRDNRTKGIGPWHKNAKDYFLNGGRFVDAINRMEVAINERMEENLELIEKHQELKELKRREDLKALRLGELKEYMEFVPNVDLGQISDEEYTKVFNGAKMQFEFKIQEELKAEEARLESERISKLHFSRLNEVKPYEFFTANIVDVNAADFGRMEDVVFSDILFKLIEAKKAYEAEQEKIRLENERLKKEAAKKEKALELERKKADEKLSYRNQKLAPYIAYIRDYDKVLSLTDADFEKELTSLNKQAMDQIEFEKEQKAKAEAEERRMQEELRLNREKQAKLEAELKAREEAEAKAEKERTESEAKAKKEAERLAKAPIKEKLTLWVNGFQIPSTDVNNDTTKDIIEKFELFKKWSIGRIENI
jgi:colicin import membrane protein